VRLRRAIGRVCEHAFVRWQNLTLAEEEGRALPGYREPAVLRRFDAPEALETRFWEVRAKSALNRVPERSRMPFRWTINPYRGCSHACSYCLSGDTEILLGDGRTRFIADLRVGDEIYGTVREGAYRRFRKTTVLDHWATIKPAFRVVLEDGTELIASGDHRFLTGRGWKHVTGSEQGRDRRPHLTLNDKLLGTGAFAPAPLWTADYRRGYLSGLIRGDGLLRSYSYDYGTVNQFRLALIDFEALQRARDFLADAGVATTEFAFASTGRPTRAIRTATKVNFTAIEELIRWPLSPSDDWCKGYLAGLFDAEGSFSQGVLRMSNTDGMIFQWATESLKRLGFRPAFDFSDAENGLAHLRFLGGLPEHLRFLHTTDPAITRKRDIEGRAVKTNARLRVTEIEPLKTTLKLYDITTGTGDFIANGVVSHNCFARPTHTYLDMGAGRDFEREIVVKVNVPELVRAELARPSWKGEHVAMGTNTDPYQWVEGRYKLMPGIWEAMRDHANPCSVLTKSPLLLRDLPLFKELVERTEFQANLSIPTLDEKAWRASEPHTPNPRARIEAVAELTRAGIPCGVLVAPLMPGINDSPAEVERILELVTEAGAVSVGGITLHLRGEVRDIFFEWLRAYRPDLLPRYEELYGRGSYARTEQRKEHQELLRRGPRPRPRPGRPRRTLRGVDPGSAAANPGTDETSEAQAPVQESLF
jgi:DNA repair photolyase